MENYEYWLIFATVDDELLHSVGFEFPPSRDDIENALQEVRTNAEFNHIFKNNNVKVGTITPDTGGKEFAEWLKENHDRGVVSD